MKVAKDIEVGANVGYLHKSSGKMIRGPLTYRDQKPCIIDMECEQVRRMLANAVFRSEPLSGGAIPVVFIENPDDDRMHVSRQ